MTSTLVSHLPCTQDKGEQENNEQSQHNNDWWWTTDGLTTVGSSQKQLSSADLWEWTGAQKGNKQNYCFGKSFSASELLW